jgi:hypothetical protein
MVVPPVAIISGTASSISAALKLVEYGLKLKDVSADIQTALSLVKTAHDNLNHTRNLRHKNKTILIANPELLTRVDKAVRDVEKALCQVGMLVEDGRVDLESNGSVKLLARFKWILANKDGFLTRERALNYAHDTLLSVIQSMEQLSLNQKLCVITEAFDDLPRSPSQRLRKQRPSIANGMVQSPGEFIWQKFGMFAG